MTRARAHGEDGFTLIEVLVGMVLALISIVAVLNLVDGSTATSRAQQRDTQAVSIGEREIEKAQSLVKQYGFASLALSSTPPGVPPASTNPVDPNAFVAGANYLVRENWHNTGSALVANEPFIVSAGTAPGGLDRLATGPETITSGTTTALVNRYVTRRTDVSCPNAACSNDSRRVVVAVRIVSGGDSQARTTPIYFSTIINNGVPSNQGNGSGGLSLGVNLP